MEDQGKYQVDGNPDQPSKPEDDCSQQIEPDVTGLVEALEDIAKLPIDPCSTENDYRQSGAKAIASAALEAYRKGDQQ